MVLRKLRNVLGSCMPTRSAKAVAEPTEEITHPDPSALPAEEAEKEAEITKAASEAEEREAVEEEPKTGLICCGAEWSLNLGGDKTEEKTEEKTEAA